MTTLLQRRIGRRTLLQQGAGLLAAPWLLSRRLDAAPPSDRVTVGFIGIGMMGRGHLRRMVSNPDVQILAVCDVDQWRVNDAKAQVETAYAAEQKKGTYKGCTAYGDFRGLLDAKTGATPPRVLAEQLYRARGYAHHDNWIQSIRMRQRPISDVESAGRSTCVGHLANIATWTGRPQKWDPIKEAFIDDAANRLRQRAMRAPWTL